MSFKEQKIIELSEKRIMVENIMHLYEDGRIHFPQESGLQKYNRETVSGLVRAIQVGIPMPVIYVSELQNGDFLVLESEERLRGLIQYIQGDFGIDIDRIPQVKDGFYFHELDEENPRLSGMILRTTFIFQIIDYRTPAYLHMEAGLFHGKWNISREQAVRRMLYKKKKIQNLEYFMERVTDTMQWRGSGKSSLTDEYTVLYMLLFWGIYRDIMWTDWDMGEQELLDAVISEIDRTDSDWIDFLDTAETFPVHHVEHTFTRLNALATSQRRFM